MIQVAFPGLGIGQFEINSTAFNLFGISVQWYGIIIALGMICAFIYCMSRAKIEGVKSDDIVDLALWMIISGVVGARLYYVIFNFKDYLATSGNFFENVGNTIVNVVSLRNGGLAIFGAIILSFFVALLFSKKKKIRFPIILDILAPGVCLAQGIGRWGNFMNGEAYGVTTDLPWRMELTTTAGGGLVTNTISVHPTFLYESLWCILGVVLMTIFYKKKKFNGQIFYFYLIWYGFERAFVEGLRTDSLYLFNTSIRVSQVVAAAIFIAGIVLIVVNLVKLNKSRESEMVIVEEIEKTEETVEASKVDSIDTTETENKAESKDDDQLINEDVEANTNSEITGNIEEKEDGSDN